MASSKRISTVYLPGSTGEDRDGTRLAREWKRRWREEQRSLTFEEKLKTLDYVIRTRLSGTPNSTLPHESRHIQGL